MQCFWRSNKIQCFWKRILSCVLVVVMAGSAASCTVLDKTGMLSNDSEKEHKAMEEFETAFFEAIEKNDTKKMKALFSPRAQEYAEDLEEGIEYILGLCGTGKIVKGKDNVSSTKYYESEGTTWEVRPYCMFTCDGREFRVNWTQYLDYGEDAKMIGVYQIALNDLSAGDNIYTISSAGIWHPGRAPINNAFRTLDELFLTDHKASDRNPKYEIPDESTWRDLWDADVFDALAQEDKDTMAKFFVDERSRKWLGAGRISYDGMDTFYFCTVRHALKSGSFGMRFNKDGKLTGIALDMDTTKMKDVKEGIHGFEGT